MDSVQKPSAVLYSTLKACGVSNRVAAEVLLDGEAEFAGRIVADILASKSQLSRRIVHASPGDIPLSCFVDWRESVPKLASQVLERHAVDNCNGNLLAAVRGLIDEVLAPAHADMIAALDAFGFGAAIYQEAIECIDRFDLEDGGALVTLHVMALSVAGCSCDGQAALANVVAYANEELGLDYQTPETHSPEPLCEAVGDESDSSFAVVRVCDGVIAAGAVLHPVPESGLVIGLLPREDNAATDVDADVSLRHARLWVEDGKLYVVDLGSTNGTAVTSPGSEEVSISELTDSTELRYGDVIRLGATTRYIVLPSLAPGLALQG